MRAKLAGAVLAAAVAGGGAAAAPTTLPGANGAFVFTQVFPGGRSGPVPQFCAAEAEGSQARAVAAEFGPAGANFDFSPDGNLLAYDEGFGSPANDVHVADADRDRDRYLLRRAAPHLSSGEPSFLPDGSGVVFSGAFQSTTFALQIWRVDLDGLRPQQLTHTGSSASPSASVTGSVAYASTRDGATEIYVVAADGSGETKLTATGGLNTQPDFSPDGRSIVFVRRDPNGVGQIWRMNADGSGQTQLTDLPGASAEPRFSPDGRLVAFEHEERDPWPDTDLYVMAPDGTGLHDLMDTDLPERSPTWQPVGARTLIRPSGKVNCAIAGTHGADTIYGTPGDDVIHAGAGDDVVYGEGGVDTIVGGSGNDVVFGGTGGDTTTGGTGDDTIHGGPEGDRLNGEDGDDTLLGEDDQDVLVGGPGNDVVAGGAGLDGVRGSEGTDVVRGGDGDDRLYGDAPGPPFGNDTLDGGRGSDLLSGGPADDLLLARDGSSDQLFGGKGYDRARVDRVDERHSLEKLLK